MDLLRVEHICKTYGSGETAVHALKDVSFSVPKGEFVAIVGESGSGKSTLQFQRKRQGSYGSLLCGMYRMSFVREEL